MRFLLIDRIVELSVGRMIVTEKALTLAEEYLADHFPRFPVMPGVLMVEAMVQSAAWLVRASTDFATSLIVLRRARNITYKSFIWPGEVLRVEVQAERIGRSESDFVGTGRVGDRQTVKARLSLRHSNLAEEDADLAELDRQLVGHYRRQWELLGGPRLLRPAASC